ncbi:MAG: DUF4147 domain-containing protein, partial [Myxococcota bacterium]
LGRRIVGGLVVVKDGHGLPLYGIDVLEAGHPEPDARSLAAGARLLAEARTAPPTETVLGLWSGGASALAEALAPGVTLEDVIAGVAERTRRGAPIEQINVFRRARSRLKGGGLARACRAPIVNLVISDVPGDRPHLVGSGPAIGAGTQDHVVARLDLAVQGARKEAATLGRITTTHLLGEGQNAETVGRTLADRANRLYAGTCWLQAGEPVVRLRADSGTGGRMQQAALAAAVHLERKDALLWFGSTDGTDGPTDIAGACIDASTADRIRAAGLDPIDHLHRQDATPALAAADALVYTGPTLTNVRDLWFALVG